MDELLAIFRAESVELIDRLTQLVDSMGEAPHQQRGPLAIEAMRVAHNLKGAALTVGHESLTTQAHEFENALSRHDNNEDADFQRHHTELLGHISQLYLLAEKDPPLASANNESNPAPTVPPSSARASSGPTEPSSQTEVVQDLTSNISVAETSLRVDTHRLETLMSHTGELLVTRARMIESYRQLEQLSLDLKQLATGAHDSQDSLVELSGRLTSALQRRWQNILAFGHLSAEINDAMKRLRMMPFSGLEPLLRRTVLKTAQALGKQVHLSLELGDIEVDKYLLDQLRDPLTHILRNAVGHGIELPAERSACDKPPRGRIQIKAVMQGTQVRVEISDDGRGLDIDQILTAALSRGLIEEDTAVKMSDAEVVALLFSPTFSTADGVSHTSGRGMGLSVAKERLEEIGGSVYIPTNPVLGGTTFYLTSPVSVVSIAVLKVQAGQQVYTVALDEVSRIFSAKASQVQTVDGMPVIRLDDGDPMRVLWLWDLVGALRSDPAADLNVLELTRGEERLGLMVQDILGEQELVIKPLPWNVELVSHINGATVLEDGSVALSLDVASLFDAASQTTDAEIAAEKGTSGAQRRILVVDDSLTSRTLGRNVLAAAGYDVSVAVDGVDAWKQLQSESFDLLVSDINMPKMDGYELTRKVRGSDTLGGLPVVLVSSLGSREDMERGIAAGANEYVVKGQYEHAQLLETVTRLFA